MLRKAIYFSFGLTSLALGIIDAFLPLLPTICFLILSAWALSKSSDQLYKLICSHKPFGPMLRNWQENRTMPRKAKPFAIGSITVSGAISCYLLQDVMILQFVTLLILPPALIYLMHLLTSHQHAAI